MCPDQDDPRVTAGKRSGVVKLHENGAAVCTISKDALRVRVAGFTRLNNNTPSNEKKNADPQTACRPRSSILTFDEKSTIQACIRAVVAKAKKRLHSPEPRAIVRNIRVERPRHFSRAANCSIGDVSLRSKQSLARAIVRRTGLTRDAVRVRFAPGMCCTFRFSVQNRTTLAWIGPVLISATNRMWEVIDVLEPCRVVINHHHPVTFKRHRSVLAFNAAQTNASPSNDTTLLGVEVARLKTCFRRESKTLDDAVVRHFAPFTNLIYAKCDTQGTVPHYIAKIDSRNTIHCLQCSKQFKNAQQLAEHVRLPASTRFKTFSLAA